MRTALPAQYNLLALAQRIQPQEGELSVAESHRTSVRRRLFNSFETASTPVMGSHARGTAIRLHSDLDVLLILRKNEVKWGDRVVSSDTILQRVKDDLQSRYPFTTVRRDVMAVALDFGNGKESLDLVPGLFSRFASSRPVYRIPDGAGDWMETSPAAHDQYFATQHVRSGNKLRKVSQLIKWWKHARQPAMPIRSFYVDMLLAGEGLCLGAKTYGKCLCDFFEAVVQRECAGYVDPCGIAGRIALAPTSAQRDTAFRAAVYARDHARWGLAAEIRGDHVEANRQWSLVFNGTY